MQDFARGYKPKKKTRVNRVNSSNPKRTIRVPTIKLNGQKPIKIALITLSSVAILYIGIKIATHHSEPKDGTNITVAPSVIKKTAPLAIDKSKLTIKTTKTEGKNIGDKVDNTPKFTFYSSLTKDKVSVENQSSNTTIPSYIIQVASYKNKDEANAMRAKLILLGLSPKINQYGQWYRVDLGPVKGSRAGDQLKHKLQQSNITGSILQKVS
jgi:cell division septation protein DedD